MSSLSDFHFLRPLWLLLLPVVAGLWVLLRRQLDPLRGWRSVMDADLLAAVTSGLQNKADRGGKLLLAAWIMAIVSLAGPAWWPEPSPFSDDPVPMMLVLKAGETMQQSDLSPQRMERSRLKASDLAKARGNEPLGLIAYSGSAHLVLPPTRDTSIVAGMALEVSPEIMPREGDQLTEALQLAVTTFGDGGGSVVVITDAVSDSQFELLEEFARKNNTSVHFLAVALPDTPELDSIQAAASRINGRTTLLTADTEDVQSILQATAGLPRAMTAADDGVRWAEAGWWLVPLIALLSLAGFRRDTRPRQMEAVA